MLVVPFIATPLQNTCRISVANLPYLHDLQLAHPFTSEPEFKISWLVGADHYWDIVGDHVIRGNGPTAVASKLGYLLSGLIQPVSQSTTTNVMMVTNYNFDLKHFWDLESVGVSLTDETAQDNMLQLYLDSCLTRDADGAYTARFPWKSTHPVLPTNIAIAERRTQHLVKRLASNPKLLQVYSDILREQEARGFIEQVDVTMQGPLWYSLPTSSSC